MIEFEVDGRAAIIRLDRVEARNAINAEMSASIEAAIDRLEDDDDLWVGILGHNGPVFCAGADLKAIAAGQGGRLGTDRGGFGGLVRRERIKPLIAAIDGHAVAGGLELALACDLRVASTRSQLGIPEVKRSLVASAGGLARLPHFLPPAIAMELALTGDTITAERAHHFGLINHLCEPGAVIDAAQALAKRIIVNSPLAVRESRQLILDAASQNEIEGMKAAVEAQRRLAATDDYAEGPRAFIEKRAPVWKGR